jgi:hypothetical protein
VQLTFSDTGSRKSTSTATAFLEMKAAAAASHTEGVSLVSSLTKTPCSFPLQNKQTNMSVTHHQSTKQLLLHGREEEYHFFFFFFGCKNPITGEESLG